MEELDKYWGTVKQPFKYQSSGVLEQIYFDLVVDKLQHKQELLLGHAWEVFSQNKLIFYEFSSDFENAFLGMNSDLDAIWEHVSKTSSFEGYTSDQTFEKEMRDIEFEMAFSYSSRVKFNEKYTTNLVFENCYEENIPVIPAELMHEKPSEKKKPSTSKKKNSQNLKNIIRFVFQNLVYK